MSKESKVLYFQHNDDAPHVNADNVEQVTHSVVKCVVNAFLWEHMHESGLIPFVNIKGTLPSGDIVVHWFPAAEAAELENRFWNSAEPQVVSLRECDRLQHDFTRKAVAMFRVAKARGTKEGMALYLEWERKRLADGC